VGVIYYFLVVIIVKKEKNENENKSKNKKKEKRIANSEFPSVARCWRCYRKLRGYRMPD